MLFRSILYKNENDLIKTALTPAMPGFFADLNLDQVINAVIHGKEEYNLKPFFYTPLHHADEIIYRQDVMKDIAKPGVLHAIRVFAQSMAAVRRQLAEAEKSLYKFAKERLFLDAVEAYCTTVLTLSARLNYAGLESAGLSGFRSYLKNHIQSASFTALLSETQELLEDLSAVRYCVFTKDLRVEVHSYNLEEDYTAIVERAFEKFKKNAVKDYRIKSGPSSMNHVEAAILEGVATLYPAIFKNLVDFYANHSNFRDETILRFDREIQFYTSYAAYISTIGKAGLKFCYPEITGTDKDIYNNGGFDLALAYKLCQDAAPVVSNSFHLTGKERIIIVSGPNQGGKTTFARTFGQLHYLAALGLPVAGSDAKLYLFDQLFSHFEKEENIKNLRSKLEDDLVRIHDILRQATPGSIIILNEILSSTTLQDAIFLSRKIMEHIAGMDALCVWVTFIDELLSLSDKTVSMVSTVVPENPALRTFKIERRPANGLAYALSIAEKYQVTYTSLLKRIKV